MHIGLRFICGKMTQAGKTVIDRQERECSDFENLDYDRGCALETWVPRHRDPAQVR